MMKHLSTISAALLLSSCATPTVNLSTPEPVKVEIEMRIDVYQHSGEQTEKTDSAKPAADPATTRRNRMTEVQALKSSRVAGEGGDGLLSLRVDPPGDYGDWARATVSAENADRMALMKAEAARLKTPLTDIQKKQAAMAQKMAFKDEWIEVENDNGLREWIQKSE
jgi:hypothetical protein